MISVDQQHMWCLPSAPLVFTIRTTRAKHQHIDKKAKERILFCHYYTSKKLMINDSKFVDLTALKFAFKHEK